MDFDYDFAKLEAEEAMEEALNNYQLNLNKISAGRANPKILDSIKIDYYGSLTPLSQLANISVPEPRQLLIKPYDASTNKSIVSAINSSSLAINAVDEGDKSRITFPELTTQRRKDLVKSLNKYTEQAKVKIRFARQNINKELKAAQLSEDEMHRLLEDVQTLTDKFIVKVENLTQEKSNDLMTI